MMSEGQMSTQCPQPSHRVMYTKVGMMLAVPSIMARLAASAAKCGWFVDGRGQIAARAVRFGKALLECCRRFEEHVRKFRPGYGSKKDRRRDHIRAEEYHRRGIALCLQISPDERQRGAG